MAMKKLQITEELYKDIYVQSQNQTEKEEFLASEDPDVELFSFEPLKRYMAYIPNNVVEIDGKLTFPKARGLSHQVYKNGVYMGTYRCIRDLVVPAMGLDGTCPLCEGKQDAWEHYNMKLDAKCAEQGLSPDDKDNDTVKSLITTLSQVREIQEPKASLYFPIIIFETDPDGKKLILDENGKPKYKALVYAVSEFSYTSIWETQMANAGVDNLAGQFLVMSYIYDTKGKKAEKRDAGKALQITFRAAPAEVVAIIEELDAAGAVLKPLKIENALTALAIYPPEELTKIKDKALATFYQLKAKMDTKQLASGGAANGAPSAQDILANFSGESVI